MSVSQTNQDVATAPIRWLASERRLLIASAAICVGAGLSGAAVGYVGPIAIAAIPGVIAAGAVLANPALGLAAIVFTLPIETAVMLPGSATLSKAVAACVLVAWLLKRLLQGDSWRPVLENQTVVIGCAFIVFALSSRLWATYTSGFNARIIRLVLLLGLCVLVFDLTRSWKRASWLIRALVAGALLAAGMVLLQWLSQGVGRAGGGIGGGINYTALILVTVLPFSFYLLRSSAESGLWRLLGALCVILTLAAVAVTFSRSSLLVLSGVLCLEGWSILRTSRSRLGLVAVLGIAALVFIKFVPLSELGERVETIIPYLEATVKGETPQSIETSSRGYHWRIALAVVQDHPFVGVGYKNYGHEFIDQYQHIVSGSSTLYTTPRSAHSSYFAILADLGLVGFGLWLGLLGVTVVHLKRAWTRSRVSGDRRHLLIIRAVGISFGALLLYGFSAEVQLEKIQWFVVGMATAVTGLAGMSRGVSNASER